RGGLDMVPSRFDLHGASEDDQVRLQIEGTQSAKIITLQQGLFQLRPGTTFSGRGTYRLDTRRAKLGFAAKNGSLADDIPGLSTRLSNVRGHAYVQGSVEGLVNVPTIKADLQSRDFSVGVASFTNTAASLRWSAEDYDLSFRADPGYSGAWHATARA